MTSENAPGCPNQPIKPTTEMTALKNTDKIRALNDRLRTTGRGGQVLITDGVLAEGLDFSQQVLEAVSTFNSFTPDNDPYQEHDCASLTVQDKKVMWKIDYYDKSLTFHSPDPANHKLTTRVLTIMLAEEY